MLDSVDRGRVIEVLEVHHVLSKGSLDVQARRFHEQVAMFSDGSHLALPGELETMREAGISDARAEIRRRAGVTSRVVRELGAGAAKVGTDRARTGGRMAREMIKRNRSEER